MSGFETTTDLSDAGKQIYLLKKRLANIGSGRCGGLGALSGGGGGLDAFSGAGLQSQPAGEPSRRRAEFSRDARRSGEECQ